MSNEGLTTADGNYILCLALVLLAAAAVSTFQTENRIDQLQEDFEQATYRCVMIDTSNFECSIVVKDTDNDR